MPVFALNRFLRPTPALATAAVAAVVLGGCSAKYDQDFFDYDREQSRTRKIFEAQYAAGAMEEATLRQSHFDLASDGTGYRLNALGRERLEYVAATRAPGETITVRLDLPADLAGDADLMFVSANAYLATMRMPDGAMTLEIGPSNQSTPAADRLAQSRKRKGEAGKTVDTAGSSMAGLFGGSAEE